MGKFLMALKELEKWFISEQRVLPWRSDPSWYRVWVSEIMLQQTQVSTVIPFFERWMNRFPTVGSLAQAQEQEVLQLWAGLGYHSRARNLRRGAQKIVEKKRFPNTREEWLEIPGVGPYTAGAILSIAGNQPEAILDGNVERVLTRLRRVGREKGESEYKKRLWRLSQIFVEQAARGGITPSHLNQGLMELGARVCTPRKPKCLQCPLRVLCRAQQKQEVESFPPKKKPKDWVHLQETVHAWINPSGEVLLVQSPHSRWRAGLWDLPHETPEVHFKSYRLLGQLETRYVVTRHKVNRLTQFWSVSHPKKTLRDFGKDASEKNTKEGASKLQTHPMKEGSGRKVREALRENSTQERLLWVQSFDERPPVGSPTRKILKKVFEFQKKNI